MRCTPRAMAVALLCVLVVPLLAFPASAAAAWPCGDGAVPLGFGATYASPTGGGCTHRGADVSAEAGGAVSAPAAGVVAFAGRVPGPHGGTVGAVSIDLADGRRLTLLPLDAIAVEAGEGVSAGRVLGDVAAGGDPSSPGAHVHVGLRAGDVYLDPLPLLGAPPLPSGAEQPEPACAPEADARPAAAASGASAVAPVTPAGAPVAGGVSPAAAAPAPGASAGVRATAVDRAPVLQPGPVPAGTPVAPRLRAPVSRGQAPGATLAAVRSAAAAAAVPIVSLAAALGLLALRRRDDVSDASSMPVDAVVGCELATAQVR